MNYLISPHDDDSVLFAAVTCQRERPTVVVVTDSYVQPARGEVGCSASERALETQKAHDLLGCQTIRLGLRDDDLTREQVERALADVLPDDVETVYVPALEGGHPQHDLVAHAAANRVSPHQLSCYSTYARLSQYLAPDLQPIGTTEVEWTRQEYDLKQRALHCYESQRRINPIHFHAIEGRSEWLSGYKRIQLGCGARLLDGWINVDWCRPAGADTGFVQADCTLDVLTNVAGEHEADYVFSEDFLEHVPPERRVHVINQCWAVLRPGGIMEHYVPNAGSRNDYGSPSHLSHWNLQTFEHFDVDSHRWAKDRAFEGIVGGFKKVSADLLNWQVEDDGVKRPQSIRVRYRAVEL